MTWLNLPSSGFGSCSALGRNRQRTWLNLPSDNVLTCTFASALYDSLYRILAALVASAWVTALVTRHVSRNKTRHIGTVGSQNRLDSAQRRLGRRRMRQPERRPQFLGPQPRRTGWPHRMRSAMRRRTSSARRTAHRGDVMTTTTTSLERLAIELVGLTEGGRSAPCQSPRHGDSWSSEDRLERAWAAAECRRACPLIDLCETAAVESSPAWGVWAGRDWGASTRRVIKVSHRCGRPGASGMPCRGRVTTPGAACPAHREESCQ
jgi:hypothetical protein